VDREGTGGRALRGRLRDAGKGLSAGDALVLAGAARDGMGAAIHVRLRFVEIARIEGREDDVAVAVGQRAGAVDPLLGTRLDAYGRALRVHLVEHRLALHVFGRPGGLQRGGLADARDVD